jgi:hypothetical protein
MAWRGQHTRARQQYLDVLTIKDIKPAFSAAVNGRADAVLENTSGPIRSARLKEIAELAVKNRLPVTNGQNMWKPADLCPMASVCPT